MRRVAVYVDGFNLYHAIDDLGKPWLKWLDLRVLSESLLRPGETLAGVHYFSAYATWLPDAYERHRQYVKALKSVGVHVCMGKFKEKPAKCRTCGAQWKTHEEKETDVNIAVKIVEDAVLTDVSRIVLICADSDLKPAIDTVRRLRPSCEFFVAAPPGRFTKARELQPRLEITSGRLARCLFPSEIRSASGELVVTRPQAYNPLPP